MARSAQTVLAAMLLGSLALTACAAGSKHAPTSRALGTHIQAVTFATVHRAIADLYENDPAVRAFTVNDVRYTPTTRDKVLSVCRSGAAASDEQALQSNKVMACAPLIYYFYSFGTQRNRPDSLAVATKLYNYAVTAIHGPFDTQQTLDNILRSWGVTVSTRPEKPPTAAGPQVLAASLISAARTAMLTSRGVHISLQARSSSASQIRRAEFDSGIDAARETLADGSAIGRLRITADGAYFSGNAAGLKRFFGMSTRAQEHIEQRWVYAKNGTSQYTSFATGSLIASIPATVLPAANDVTVTSTTNLGVAVYRLTWKTFGGADATTAIIRSLDLTAAGNHLPLSEISASHLGSQTATFTRWGELVTVDPPTNVVSFSAVTSE